MSAPEQRALPADLEPAHIEAQLESVRYGRSLRVVALTDSTNDDARRDARSGAVDGHVVLADGQRAGRGSNGRSWTSPAGSDLYLSIVARPQLSLAQLPPLTLAVGLGVADAVTRTLSELASAAGDPAAATTPEVKWPNDVWLGGRKCAGILLEAESSGDAGGPVVIGIGLNVNRTRWPVELEGQATSLRLASAQDEPLDRARALATLLARVEHWVDVFVREGGEAIAHALDSRLALRDQIVTCGETRGRLVGVAPGGGIVIDTGERLRELVSGRITLA